VLRYVLVEIINPGSFVGVHVVPVFLLPEFVDTCILFRLMDDPQLV
jgi:hypothetical protein